MNAKRQRIPAAKAAIRSENVLPVVVTLDGNGGVVDIVGDLASLVGGGDTIEVVVSRLSDLICGEEDFPERLGAVELSENRFVDINIFFEGDLRHFVLRDVSAMMQSLRARQQLDHEVELEQERISKLAGRERNPVRSGSLQQRDRVFRQGAGLLEMVSTEMREALMLLSGHVQLLARRLQDDASALGSVAAMQHAVMRLDALSSNALVGLGELATGKEQRGKISVDGLAGYLQDSFSLQASMRGIHFELRVPELPTLIEVNDLDLRRLLVNLIVHALDGMSHGELHVAMRAKSNRFEIELEARPNGLEASRFGELVTTVDLLQSNAHGSLLLAASQALLQRLEAEVELVERVEGGSLLWLHIPVSIVADSGPEDSAAAKPPGLDARLVVISLENAEFSARIIAALQAKGIPAIGTQAAGKIAAVLCSGELRAMVVAEGHELAQSGVQPMMVVLQDSSDGDKDAWTYDRGTVQVGDAIGDDALQEALDALLAY